MKNVIKLGNYYTPSDLEISIGTFVQYYNHEHYRESLENLTPADVYFGKEQEVITQREKDFATTTGAAPAAKNQLQFNIIPN